MGTAEAGSFPQLLPPPKRAFPFGPQAEIVSFTKSPPDCLSEPLNLFCSFGNRRYVCGPLVPAKFGYGYLVG